MNRVVNVDVDVEVDNIILEETPVQQLGKKRKYTRTKISLSNEPQTNEPESNESQPNEAKKAKTSKHEFVLPTIKTYLDMPNKKYSVAQLKEVAKHYELKISGNKTDLFNRIYEYLKGSFYSIMIQKSFRGCIQRRLLQLAGPALKNKLCCVNDTDFVTMEPLNEISPHQFYSYKDVDGVIYGFDVLSLMNMIAQQNKEGKKLMNPYTRNKINENIVKDLRQIVVYNKILGRRFDFNYIEEGYLRGSVHEQFERRAITVFQKINSFGHYSQASWLINLSRNSMIRFILELVDIWHHRAGIREELRRQIVPPNGNPFLRSRVLSPDLSEIEMQTEILNIIEKFIGSAQEQDNRNLGAFYILGALTIVCPEAAETMPWLHQTFI